jgi:hypothetical protein
MNEHFKTSSHPMVDFEADDCPRIAKPTAPITPHHRKIANRKKKNLQLAAELQHKPKPRIADDVHGTPNEL